MDPVVIQCAVTGSADAGPPNLPASPAAIVESALAAWEAGAAVLHLHAREDDGTPTQAVDRFAALVEALRSAGCDAVLNLSTGSAGGRASYEQRMAVLELAPEMASFDAGTINFGPRIFEGERHFLEELAGRFRAHGVVPEVECFDTGYLGTLHELVAAGTLDPDPLVQLVVGVPGSGVPATVEQVGRMRELVPAGSPWTVAAIGRAQLPLNAHCLLAGGHVRTGLEDNLWYAKGERATNAALVARVVRLAAELQRPVATPAEARALLGVRPR